MPYSEAELEEIERDPVRLRGYFWHVAMNAKRMAAQNRAASRATGFAHPVTNYLPAFEEGRDLMHWASVLDSFSEIVLGHIDTLVETTVKAERSK